MLVLAMCRACTLPGSLMLATVPDRSLLSRSISVCSADEAAGSKAEVEEAAAPAAATRQHKQATERHAYRSTGHSDHCLTASPYKHQICRAQRHVLLLVSLQVRQRTKHSQGMVPVSWLPARLRNLSLLGEYNQVDGRLPLNLFLDRSAKDTPSSIRPDTEVHTANAVIVLTHVNRTQSTDLAVPQDTLMPLCRIDWPLATACASWPHAVREQCGVPQGRGSQSAKGVPEAVVGGNALACMYSLSRPDPAVAQNAASGSWFSWL